MKKYIFLSITLLASYLSIGRAFGGEFPPKDAPHIKAYIRNHMKLCEKTQRLQQKQDQQKRKQNTRIIGYNPSLLWAAWKDLIGFSRIESEKCIKNLRESVQREAKIQENKKKIDYQINFIEEIRSLDPESQKAVENSFKIEESIQQSLSKNRNLKKISVIANNCPVL